MLEADNPLGDAHVVPEQFRSNVELDFCPSGLVTVKVKVPDALEETVKSAVTFVGFTKTTLLTEMEPVPPLTESFK